MNTITVYISGPMSGLPNYNFPAFDEAVKFLHSLGENVLAVNPANIGRKIMSINPKPKYTDFLREDLKALINCDCVFVLPNFEKSRGVKIELSIAEALELPIFFSRESMKSFVESIND